MNDGRNDELNDESKHASDREYAIQAAHQSPSNKWWNYTDKSGNDLHVWNNLISLPTWREEIRGQGCCKQWKDIAEVNDWEQDDCVFDDITPPIWLSISPSTIDASVMLPVETDERECVFVKEKSTNNTNHTIENLVSEFCK